MAHIIHQASHPVEGTWGERPWVTKVTDRIRDRIAKKKKKSIEEKFVRKMN